MQNTLYSLDRRKRHRPHQRKRNRKWLLLAKSLSVTLQVSLFHLARGLYRYMVPVYPFFPGSEALFYFWIMIACAYTLFRVLGSVVLCGFRKSHTVPRPPAANTSIKFPPLRNITKGFTAPPILHLSQIVLFVVRYLRQWARPHAEGILEQVGPGMPPRVTMANINEGLHYRISWPEVG